MAVIYCVTPGDLGKVRGCRGTTEPTWWGRGAASPSPSGIDNPSHPAHPSTLNFHLSRTEEMERNRVEKRARKKRGKAIEKERKGIQGKERKRKERKGKDEIGMERKR